MYDGPGGYDEVVKGYELAPRRDADLLEAIHAACAPAHPNEVTRELTRLRVGTVGRASDVGEIEAWLTVVGQELEGFPLDVIRHACVRWLRREKWTPSVAELIEECHRAMKRRESMRLAVMRAPA